MKKSTSSFLSNDFCLLRVDNWIISSTAPILIFTHLIVKNLISIFVSFDNTFVSFDNTSAPILVVLLFLLFHAC